MNKIQTLAATGAQSMSSLEIALVTGKMHKDVMKVPLLLARRRKEAALLFGVDTIGNRVYYQYV